MVRDVQNLSGKQEDDTKRNMQKVAKGNKTIQKMRHDMMNQKYGRESGYLAWRSLRQPKGANMESLGQIC